MSDLIAAFSFLYENVTILGRLCWSAGMKIKIKFKLMAVAEVAERRSQVGCLNAKSVGERLGCKLQQGDITLCIILYVIPHILQALLKLFPLPYYKIFPYF